LSSPHDRLYVTSDIGNICKELATPLVEQAVREYGVRNVLIDPQRYTGLSWDEVKEPLIALRVYPPRD
jgi:hypothetical protein